MTAVAVRADEHGEIDYQDLAAQVDQRRDRPAIIVANIGTAMSEAVDDVRRITQVLDAARGHPPMGSRRRRPVRHPPRPARPRRPARVRLRRRGHSDHRVRPQVPRRTHALRRAGGPGQPPPVRHPGGHLHRSPRQHPDQLTLGSGRAQPVADPTPPRPGRSARPRRTGPRRGHLRARPAGRDRLARTPPPARVHGRAGHPTRRGDRQVAAGQSGRAKPHRVRTRRHPRAGRRVHRRPADSHQRPQPPQRRSMVTGRGDCCAVPAYPSTTPPSPEGHH